MSDDFNTLLQAAADLARHAGTIALRYFRTGLVAETKNDGSPVTQADREAERAARDWLSRRFPRDSVLGEEFGEEKRGHRRWLIDPIDGTKSFVRNVPMWGTLVAVEENGEVLAGAAYYPAVEELLTAARGEGCWRNGSRCHVSAVSDLSSATVLTTDDRFPADARRRRAWVELSREAAVARTWGDCYGYLMVATGRAEAMIDDVASEWDVACMQPIIVEAGGVFSDFAGRATPFGGSAIATNALLAARVRSIVNDR